MRMARARPRDEQTDRQAARQTGSQAARQPDSQTDRERERDEKPKKHQLQVFRVQCTSRSALLLVFGGLCMDFCRAGSCEALLVFSGARKIVSLF